MKILSKMQKVKKLAGLLHSTRDTLILGFGLGSDIAHGVGTKIVRIYGFIARVFACVRLNALRVRDLDIISGETSCSGGKRLAVPAVGYRC